MGNPGGALTWFVFSSASIYSHSNEVGKRENGVRPDALPVLSNKCLVMVRVVKSSFFWNMVPFQEELYYRGAWNFTTGKQGCKKFLFLELGSFSRGVLLWLM